ncbi:hypothetical protein HMPREF1624_00080 [Sporothrix schenckii ATCC 58251]|uniref:YCII-related domain-containing protein n=2 Tax=Sporothrix schenckii TaxID=29908 RepID=U7Q4Y6_SPOS1|nr:hypothetical protein HMPREF1624_00080 [Sporothrix schenckii ATCC 58251]
MADSAPQTEWLVVVPDFPNTIQKRLDIRPTHFANLEPVKSRLKFGGAILKDKPSDPADPKTFDFAGSSFIVLADSKQEVIEFLKKDVYVEAGVWDVANAQIYAMKTAFRVP